MRHVLALITALALPAVPAAAQDAQDSGWHFVLTPYFMAPTMDGKAAVGPVATQVSTSPSDIFSHLNWGAMGIIEANNGRFGAALDITYMNLETRRDGFVDKIGGHQGAYTGMLLARFDRHAEAYVGARVNDIGLTVRAAGPLGNTASATRSKTWVDPIIGVRTHFDLSPGIDLTILTDVGGFGAASDITVHAWPSLGIRLGGSIRAQLGYRLIYTKYESGSNLDLFVYDVLTYGPTAGLQFRF